MDERQAKAIEDQQRQSETEWVRQAQGGDAAAFESLVRAYHRRALSLAYRLLGNSEDAQDVSQDAFVRAFRSLSQLEDPSRFGGWFMRIVGNLSLNFRRSRATRRATSLDEIDATTLDVRSPSTGARSRGQCAGDSGGDTSALPSDLHQSIAEALERLPDKQRLALTLFSIEHMPQKQVAEVLECSVEMVKWNVFQARKRLRQSLAEYL